MIWADKLGLLWAFLVYAFLFVIAEDRAALFAWPATHDILIIILPVWIFLRLIDWIAGGPARRSGRVIGRVIR